jgi:hypothetical protein
MITYPYWDYQGFVLGGGLFVFDFLNFYSLSFFLSIFDAVGYSLTK